MLVVVCARAQQADNSNPLRIAILVPLYTDSAFNGTEYKLGNADLPRQMIPGLDFYNGALLAIDSLQKEQANLEVWVYDTKQEKQSLQQTLSNLRTQNIALLIASFNNSTEQKMVSDFAFSQNVPVISATYPNEAGVTTNPFFILVNSTLKTHIEAIYNYAWKNYNNRIILFTRKGLMEDRIAAQFTAMDKVRKPALRYKTVVLPDNFSDTTVLRFLDSTRNNVVMTGSLNEAFGASLVKALGSNSSYRVTAIGMPTWDGIFAFNKAGNANVELVYSTPYNYTRTEGAGAGITNAYKARWQGRPSDMVFKGFESVYHFSKLLLKHRSNFINNVSDSAFIIFNEFRFEPVMATDSSFAPDYMENRKLYFVKKQNGVIKSVN